MESKVTLCEYESRYDEQLLKVSVAEEQLQYVGKVEDLIGAKVEGWKYHVIKSDEDVVGFFNIDMKYSERYEFAGDRDLGFRAFFVDKKYQGRGIGSSTMNQMRSYIGTKYPNWDNLVLTVNCRNLLAYKLYTKYGFEDNGELYHGGTAGPQHVLRMGIN